MKSSPIHSLSLSPVTQVQAVAAGGPMNGLLGRASCDYRLIVMGVGISVAVIGVVAAIAMQSVLFGLGFTITAVVMMYGTYYVSSSPTDEEIEKGVKNLKERDVQLQQLNQQMESTTRQLQVELAQVKTINQNLTQNIELLRRRFEEIQRLNGELARNNESLQSSIQSLQASNTLLQQKIDELQRAIPLLRSQVETFVKQNTELARQLGVLESGIGSLDRGSSHLAQNIQGFDQVFDQNVLDLAREIQNAQRVSHSVFEELRKQRESIGSQLTTLQSSVSKIDLLDQSIKEKTTSLANLELQIQIRTQHFQQAQLELQQIQQAFLSEKQALEVLARQLTATQSTLSQEELRFREVQKQLKDTFARFSTLEAELTQKLGDLEKSKLATLSQLDQRITQKIEKLKHLKELTH